MSTKTSHASSIKLTRNSVLGGAVVILLPLIAFLGVRYVDAYIPKLIESEVRKEFDKDVKIQIAEEVKNNIAGQIQTANKEFLTTIRQDYKDTNVRIDDLHKTIDDLYKTISGKPEILAPTLKRGTRRNHHASLVRTVPVTRELLAHARDKALSEPKEAAVLTQVDINQITSNLFTRYSDSALNHELWDTLLELASYKTVVSGIKFGPHQAPGLSNEVESLNDRKLKNEIIIGKVVQLAQCGVDLRNVRFVNCTFDVERGTNGEKLLRTLLESNRRSISIRLPPPPGYVKGECEK